MRPADTGLTVALVTGACSGIGLAIARELAALGYSLVLVSNRGAQLEQAAEELRRVHAVEAHTIVLDLAQPAAAATLYDEVRLRGIDVDILVNNAGMLLFGEVADVDPAAANTMLQLHVVTPSLLCRYFGHDMRERRRGHVLVVSSISAWQDFPGIALYGSSKRYLRSFAASLRSELKLWGVNVTCLAPGATATALYDPNLVDVAMARRYGVMMDAEGVARASVRAMFRRKAVHVPGLLARLMTWGAMLTPRWLIDLLRRRAPWLPKPASDERSVPHR